MTRSLTEALKCLSPLDALTVVSCIHNCATLDKKQRAEFQKQFGMKIDENITNLMQDLSKKRN